ncbi:2-aminoadipate transaminase [Propionispira arboris]|uniref:2-aminoadipate transaminase n=1 Tax=Propionispira arboris TaxID=84035 RepID=A0A1H6ZA40_9FIRM|nr:PLP-dependent aminotransferase family protein [Propionispira arboris]SEJ46532.1 2-aminoadipate transaminase [Propionispira arboris]
MTVTFARRMDGLKASEIREILKLTQQKDMISFAGGLPAPESFPVEAMQKVAQKVLEQQGSQALQYSTTEGYEPLREKIAERMNRKFATSVQANNVLITCGSQQALDFSGKLFLNEGDIVLCESPTYLAAISALKAYQPRFIAIPTDAQGMVLAELEKTLASQKNVKLIYVIPDFQNPTGNSWPLERRRGFMEIINRYHIPVIEDNPYGELRFENKIIPALKSMDTNGLVIFTSTFSKTFCPGLRIGWIAAEEKFIEKYVLIKQGADLCTSIRGQMEIATYMDDYDFEENVEKLIQLYRVRRDVMIEMLEKKLPQNVTFTHPQGGLFLWVQLPEDIDASELLQDCLKKKVAFIPGESFFPNGGGKNTFRLNYSNMAELNIREGIKRLVQAILEYQTDSKKRVVG